MTNRRDGAGPRAGPGLCGVPADGIAPSAESASAANGSRAAPRCRRRGQEHAVIRAPDATAPAVRFAEEAAERFAGLAPE